MNECVGVGTMPRGDLIETINELTEVDAFSTLKILCEAFDGAESDAIVEACARVRPSRTWANLLINSDVKFPIDLILQLLPKATVCEKIVALEKYRSDMSDEQIGNCINDINNSFAQDNYDADNCAEQLISNLDTFKLIEEPDIVLIFMMYIAAKQDEMSQELVDAINAKVTDALSPRLRVVNKFFNAGWLKKNNQNVKCSQLVEDAKKIFVDAFKLDADSLDNNSRYAKWKFETTESKILGKAHFAAFTSTVFKCENPDCSQHDIGVYLSHCWNCGEIIDSRDSRGKDGGFYICAHCSSGRPTSNRYYD